MHGFTCYFHVDKLENQIKLNTIDSFNLGVADRSGNDRLSLKSQALLLCFLDHLILS